MEFYQELLITAVLSVLIAFLIGKIAVLGASDGDPAVDATVSADCDASFSTGGKSEESALKETEASADRSGTEEKHVGTEQEVFVDASKNSLEGASMLRVEEDFSAKLLDTVDNLCSSGDALKEKEEVKVEGVEINTERESEGDITEGSLLHGEDEWEGIEKSELEKLFGSAAEYVCGSSSAADLTRLSSDVRMELYGLSKIATEGPCYESQPLPLNFSARSKWQAWQKLGNMTPEVAMELYVKLLSKNIPGWMDKNSGASLVTIKTDIQCDRSNDFSVEGAIDSGSTDLRLSSQHQPTGQSTSEDVAHVEVDHAMEELKILEQGFASTMILNLLSPSRGAFLSIMYW